jgi:tetratricopeptide (TPR) repeat protein
MIPRHAKGKKVRAERDELLANGNGLRKTESLFAAEAAYANGMFRSALGDRGGCIDALQRSLECLPTYAPALLSLGSVEYQLGHRAKGWKLFMALLDLPDDTEELRKIIDEAGVGAAVRATKACTAKPYRHRKRRSRWNPTIKSL